MLTLRSLVFLTDSEAILLHSFLSAHTHMHKGLSVTVQPQSDLDSYSVSATATRRELRHDSWRKLTQVKY